MTFQNFEVYASQPSCKTEHVGYLSSLRYQQIKRQVWSDRRLYAGVSVSIIRGTYRTLNRALNMLPDAIFVILLVLAFFNKESGLSVALTEGIKNPLLLVEGFLSLAKFAFVFALVFVFLSNAINGVSSPSSTFDALVKKAVAKELNINPNMEIDVIGESINSFVKRAQVTVGTAAN
jgi:ABC-type transport system involved in multi-copper enzyme maturation permease subunit